MSLRPDVRLASLDEEERRTLERFLVLLEDRLGDDLVSVWLFGSRARGERPHPESDVDVMVVTREGASDRDAVHNLLFEAGERERTNPFLFSIQVVDPEWLADRRRIESFFMQEVDRDKVVLAGQA